MKNFVRDNRWMWGAKCIAALFQGLATWHVFDNLFKAAGRSDLERYITNLTALLLIDVLFLAMLFLLESHELDAVHKTPYALIVVGLSVAVVWIGIEDEGKYAWMPRIGFLGLAGADVFNWLIELTIQGIKQYSLYYSRERVEQRLLDRQVLFRRKAKLAAWKKAQKRLEKELIQLQIDRERRTWGIEEQTTEPAQPITQTSDTVIQLAAGKYGWYHPVTGELKTHTALGKPYASERGAWLAYKRAEKAA